MNKETYEALKRITNYIWNTVEPLEGKELKDLEAVINWIDEVAKDYEK